MTPNPAIMQSIEQLGHRVTVGDVATQVGLELNQAEQGLLALASDAGGHLQVADTGDIVYQFPPNFRAVLRGKYRRLQWQAWWEKVWNVLFYVIRISFGIILVLSIVLMIVAIAVIVIALSSANKDDNRSSSSRSRSFGGGGMFFFPRYWFVWGPDPFWLFRPNYQQHARQRRNLSGDRQSELNFLEAIFSFLFGDGNPNDDLEERRWQSIGHIIRGHGGAVAAQQLAPYCDEMSANACENEDYVLPALTKFNGQPKVSEQGDIVYYFPELQVTAKQRDRFKGQAYLKEKQWQFSQASSSQKLLAIGLGALNIVLALVLGSLLQEDVVAQLGGLIAFVDAIYGLLLAYGIAFLAVPLLRYFWLQRLNRQIEARNQMRQERAIALNQDETLRQKMAFAQQFAQQQKIISDHDITYATDKDVLDQDIERADQIDEEWRRRLESR